MKGSLALLALLFTSACGYHVSGHADMMPKSIKSICIPSFGNATTRYRLTDMLPEALSREFIARTRYQIVNDMNQADAILRGTVVNYFAFPTTLDQATGRASTVQAIVIMQVSLTERTTGKVLYARPLDWKQQYEISSDPRAFVDESDAAMRRISRDVARSIVSAVVENF